MALTNWFKKYGKNSPREIKRIYNIWIDNLKKKYKW